MTPTPVKVPFVDFHPQHQPIQTEIERAIQETVDRGDFVLGKALTDLEAKFSTACGVGYGVGVASGTDAIALGLQACGIKKGDEVLIPANTFIATAIGAIGAGATPVFVDCDPHTALIDLECATRAITAKTKAIIPVHLYGQMVSPKKLQDFAKSHNLLIFEDAAQAHLATREGYRAGSIGTAAGFSFYPSKNLGAFGNGGMAITKEETIAKTIKTLRNYGAPSKYFHTELGKNSRLDSLQAAILGVKLPHLEDWNLQRNKAAQYYDKLLKPLESLGITPIVNEAGTGHVYHLYVIRLHNCTPDCREVIQAKLLDLGIQTGIHYPIPCHLQPAYNYLNYQKGDFPYAEALCEQILSLPMYPGISDEQVESVCDRLTIVWKEIGKS
jgi:dTDP-4-amino-4,6-dideoxygalactose transaminase